MSYLGKMLGVPATIVVPTTVVEEKVRAMQEYGASVIREGRFFDERFTKALELQKSTGALLIPPFDNPHIIAGQGTIGLEIFESLTDVDAVIVPIGGGGLISGIATAIKNLKPEAQVVGVEPERASSMYQSVKSGKITRLTDTTSIADGLAVRAPGELTFDCVKRCVDEILLVSEEQIERAVYTTMKEGHVIIEPSAAAAVAALTEKFQSRKGLKVVVVISGGNISLKMLHTILSKYS